MFNALKEKWAAGVSSKGNWIQWTNFSSIFRVLTRDQWSVFYKLNYIQLIALKSYTQGNLSHMITGKAIIGIAACLDFMIMDKAAFYCSIEKETALMWSGYVTADKLIKMSAESEHY